MIIIGITEGSATMGSLCTTEAELINNLELVSNMGFKQVLILTDDMDLPKLMKLQALKKTADVLYLTGGMIESKNKRATLYKTAVREYNLFINNLPKVLQEISNSNNEFLNGKLADMAMKNCLRCYHVPFHLNLKPTLDV